MISRLGAHSKPSKRGRRKFPTWCGNIKRSDTWKIFRYRSNPGSENAPEGVHFTRREFFGGLCSKQRPDLVTTTGRVGARCMGLNWFLSRFLWAMSSPSFESHHSGVGSLHAPRVFWAIVKWCDIGKDLYTSWHYGQLPGSCWYFFLKLKKQHSES